MNNDDRDEILFNIQSFFDEQVDEFQLFNQITDEGDCFQLNAYGEKLQFSKETGDFV